MKQLFELKPTRGQTPEGSYVQNLPDGIYSVHLQLTAEGAAALLALTQRIGGSSDNTPRGMTSALTDALYDAGVCCDNPNAFLARDQRLMFSSWPGGKTPREEAIEAMEHALVNKYYYENDCESLRAALKRLKEEKS